MAAQFGPWNDTRKFQEHVLGGETVTPMPKENGWQLVDESGPPAFGIEELRIPIDRFRIPPKELEETLPQQLLMLEVAAAALDDCATGERAPGVRIGSEHRRLRRPRSRSEHDELSLAVEHAWRAGGGQSPEADRASPPLTANRTMGALGSIAASRIARAFHFGGPSHTVCSEEASAARAIELGVRALQGGELDRALVGGVDLACDPRTVLPGEVPVPGEGAAAFRAEAIRRRGARRRPRLRGHSRCRGGRRRRRARGNVPRVTPGDDFDAAIAFDAANDVGNTGAASARGLACESQCSRSGRNFCREARRATGCTIERTARAARR